MPSYPVLPPGATTDVPGTAINGTDTPAGGELWDFYDNTAATVIATASSPGTPPNDWDVAKDGTGGFLTKVPATASTANPSPAVKCRMSPTFMAS